MSADGAAPLRMTIPSDTRFLHVVASFARNACLAAGLGEADADKMALATDEAVTNVIEHAYHGRPGETIEIRFDSAQGGIAIHVIHDGDPVDVRQLPTELDPEAMARRRRRGGLGVFLMRRLVDRVDYRSTDDRRNECCLWKGRPETGAGDGSGG
jgi:anti-sigma regulatory factor (Ser/Thr protein kinase)